MSQGSGSAAGTGPGGSGNLVTVRRSPSDPNRLFFDFDAVAPGGRGGASVRLDPDQALASIDGIHKNALLPPRSTGRLLAEGLSQAISSRLLILEGFNVERTTAIVLKAGGSGQSTRIGNLLGDVAQALGGTIARWEPVKNGTIWNLRVHLDYP